MLGGGCVYTHESRGLFLSVYAGDVHLVGSTGQLAPNWADVRRHLGLDPFDGRNGSVELGVTQHVVPLDLENGSCHTQAL